MSLSQAMAAGEAEDRRDRSNAILAQLGVAVLQSLPVIETQKRSLRCSEAEVATRAIALLIAAANSGNEDHSLAQRLTVDFGTEAFFTPLERAFLNDPQVSQQDNFNASWRYEGVHAMFWALGLTVELLPMDRVVDVSDMAAMMQKLGTEGIIARARLRPQSDLLDAADLISRADWAVVEAQVQGAPIPPGLNGDIVYERHYALNWLIGYGGLAWDDVSTDT
jgi:hypothetical protein